MRTFRRFRLLLLIPVLSLAFAGCDKADTKTKLARYTAQADTANAAVAKVVELLHGAGRIAAPEAKEIYEVELRVLEAGDLVRDRASSGFDKPTMLAVLRTLLEDVRKADGRVTGVQGQENVGFRETINTLIFTITSLEAVIAALKEPALTPDQDARVQAILAYKPAAASRAGGSALASDITLVSQKAFIRIIDQSRMDAAAAFADGKLASAALREDLKAKIAALTPVN